MNDPVSSVTLGTVQFGLSYGIANREGKPTAARVRDLLRRAHAGGVRALDTAAAYGDSEQVIGDALGDLGLADAFTLVTKVPPLDADAADPDGFIEKSVEQSLARLGVARVAAVLFHSEDDWPHLPRLQRLVERGWMGAAGLSLDSDRCLAEAADATVVQLPYNAADHRFENFLDGAAARGVTVFARSAYLQGALIMDNPPPHLAALAPVRERLAGIAADAGLSARELYFRYVLSRTGVDSLVVGVDTAEQLAENLAYAAAGPLPEAVVDAMRAAVPDLPEAVVRPKLWPPS